MSFLPETRRYLGYLAFLAPLPLPFNQVLEWPLLLLYLLLVTVFLYRCQDPNARWLPTWVMNLLAVAYVPLLLLDLRMLSFRGQLVQTVVHLAMFAVLVKLYSLRSEGDKWITLGTVFFLFLASMGTSVHPSVMLYLLAFAGLGLATLLRFALFHTLASFGRSETPLEGIPLRRFSVLTTALAVVLAVPLFAVFPRIQNPVIGVRGVGTGTVIHAAGFTDDVTLDSIGGLRNNPEVVMRLRLEDDRPLGEELRFKGGTYDRYFDRRWWTSQLRTDFLTSRDGNFRLGREDVEPESWLEIWLQPINTRALFLPVEARRLEISLPVIAQSEGGALYQWRPPSSVTSYRVGLGSEPRSLATPPDLTSPYEPTLKLDGISQAVVDLAGQIAAGEVTPRKKAAAIERHLTREYTYSLGYVGRPGERPLDDFLFRYRQGHCELFASAMVVMLRSQGIPSRLVTGFLGAEHNPLTGYYVVRQSNAHAWVEAYLEGEGWQVYDPTPPAGRPTNTALSSWSIFQQMSDYLMFRWDRYVLTYGFQDQLAALWKVRGAWEWVRSWFDGEDEEGDSPVATPAAAEAEQGTETAEVTQRPPILLLSLALAVLAALAFFGWRRHATPPTATRTFERLKRLLSRAGVPMTPSTPPLALGRSAGQAFPEAAQPTALVIDFYLRESFGGQQLADEDHRQLAEALDQARRSLRRKAG